MDNKKIGKIIAKRRKEKGMTQSELAEKLGVTNKTISKWETGMGLPDISILVDLANALDMSVDDLLKGKENEVQNEQYGKEKTFLIQKQYYKSYLKKSYFGDVRNWLFNFIGIMFILGGFSFLPLNHYIQHYVDILGKGMIVIGVILALYPIMIFIYKICSFKEYESYYTIKDNGVLYQQDDETIFYSFSQFEMIKDQKYFVLQKNNKTLFMDIQDIEQVERKVKQRQIHKGYFFISFLSSVVGCFLLILQLGYYIVLKRFGFEYIHATNEILFSIIILCCVVIDCCFIMKREAIIKYVLLGCLNLVVISIFALNSYQETKDITSFSSGFQNRAVFKYNEDEHQLNVYHYTYLCFAKKSDTISTGLRDCHGEWLTSDCYLLTYLNENDERKVQVATFGDRGNGISYFNILPALQGEWFNQNDGETNTYLKEENGMLTLEIEGNKSVFDDSNVQQNGTIGLTLSKVSLTGQDKEQYVIVLDENCVLNENNLLDKKGTIQVYDIKKETCVTLYCGTYKEDKQEQETIDEQMREDAKKLVNKMDDALKKDSALSQFEDTHSLFKIKTTSKDFYAVTRDAFFHSLKMTSDGTFTEQDQIQKIKVLAGNISDFYVNMTCTSTVSIQGETETVELNKNYRIKQGKGCYLIADIGYRVPGDIGLVKCESVIEKDVSTDSNYAYSTGK